MLCGAPPFTSDNPFELAVMHSRDVVVPPGRRIDARGPVGETVLLRLLAKQPGERFRSPQEAAAAVDAWRESLRQPAHVPVEPPASPPEIPSDTTPPPPADENTGDPVVVPRPVAPPPRYATLNSIVPADLQTQDSMPASAADRPPEPGTPRPGLQIAGYEILEELGRGATGVVYKARETALGRVVALKMILAWQHAGPHERTRFRVEAEAIARLQHPNIVQLFAVGEHDSLPFISLEFVDGGTLARKLAGEPLPPNEAAGLMEKLARAIHYAHLRGVVHRDLKPANVLLTKDGEPKITDFGLAKQLDASSGLSQSGVVMGTPSYMAPEQAAGKVRDTGPAADVYALGTVLYQLLTGRPPFQGVTTFEVLAQVTSVEPVPPARLNPKVPRDLGTVCLKCLHKDPARRYASAVDLADDLRRWREGRPITARPVSLWQRGLKWCRRNPTVAALLLIAVLLLGSTVGVTIWALKNAAEVRQKEKDRPGLVLPPKDDEGR
jgi:hypothetical protein